MTTDQSPPPTILTARRGIAWELLTGSPTVRPKTKLDQLLRECRRDIADRLAADGLEDAGYEFVEVTVTVERQIRPRPPLRAVPDE